MRRTLVKGGTLVSGGKSFRGYLEITGDRITCMGEGEYTGVFDGTVVDAAGMLVLPGVIDDHVHFREPGLTHKADIGSESAAAVAGGVTSFMDMPNTIPPAVSAAELERKFERAAETSLANYSFYLGATPDNIREINNADPKTVCGVKVFMGSSTGGMLVGEGKALEAVFAESPVTVAVHCEYEPMIRSAAHEYRQRFGDDVPPSAHPLIRSAEACYRSSAEAVELADRYGTDLHVLHVSTERELSLFDPKPLAGKKITSEICVNHLWFNSEDYAEKGNLIKCNPAIKSEADRRALRESLSSGKGDIVATDHAPHTLQEKQLPYWECPSGIPMVQHSLVAMLELCSQGVFGVEKVVEKMCHAPAVRFGIRERGFLREGYYADVVIVDPQQPWTVSRENILYKCGWSPLEGTLFTHKVLCTIINGIQICKNGDIDTGFRGMPLKFKR